MHAIVRQRRAVSISDIELEIVRRVVAIVVSVGDTIIVDVVLCKETAGS